jgi:hypothetical protein
MFSTIGRTWGLAKSSWAVLKQDRELVLFPILSAVTLIAVMAVFLGVAAATGSLDRIDAMVNNDGTTQQSANVVDIVLLVLMTVVAYFIVIFFNASLIAAARERLKGGNPTLASGFRATTPHLGNILGWAIIAGSVGLILSLLRSRSEDNILGRIAISIVGGVWAYMTFFVVPFLVVQGVGPIEAIKRSAGLFKRTWGEQFVANFGFGLVYLVAALVAFLPAALLFALSPVVGIIVGVVLVAIALGIVAALEGIFKVALFEYANEGMISEGFTREDLAGSYRPR